MLVNITNEISHLSDGVIKDEPSDLKYNDIEVLLSISGLRNTLKSVFDLIDEVSTKVSQGKLSDEDLHMNLKGDFVSLVKALKLINDNVKEKYVWYKGILDSIPFLISVTDMDMNWTFINKPVEHL